MSTNNDFEHRPLERIGKATNPFHAVRNREFQDHLKESEDPHNFSQLLKNQLGSTAKRMIPLEEPDGNRTQFTLPIVPVANYRTGFFLVYLNGILQEPDDHYSASEEIVEFVVAPFEGDKIRVIAV